MSSSTSGEQARPGSAGSPGPSPSGGAGSEVIFRERMSPAPWVWAAGAFLGFLGGLTVFPFGWYLAAVAIVLFIVMITGTLLVFSPVVVVSGGELVAGQAQIPAGLLGAVTVLDAGALRHALGPGLDARAYLCMRGWITRGVRVELTDPDDPTPYWVITSRRPAELAAAIEQAKSDAGAAG